MLQEYEYETDEGKYDSSSGDMRQPVERGET